MSHSLRGYGPSIVLLLIFLGSYQWARSHSYRDPGSQFFDAQRAYHQEYSMYRQREVEQTDIMKENGHNATTCAIIVTFKRPIDLTVRSALAGLYPEEQRDLHLAVLFAHADPADHPSWGIQVDQSISYRSSAINDLPRLAEYEHNQDTFHKGAHDYALAMEYCMNTSMPWAAIFEDDVLFADGWYAHLKHALLQPDEDARSLLYYRMFNDERATGWSGRGLFANKELHISAIVDVLILVLFLLCRVRRSITIPVLVFIPAAITLFYACGKATMLPPRPGAPVENFGCCSQALIFPKHQLLPLLTYLRAAGSGQVDMHIDAYGRQHGFHRRSIYPTLLQHRGAQLSSVRGTPVHEAKQIWSMAFGKLNPRWLQQQHRDLASKIWHSRAEM